MTMAERSGFLPTTSKMVSHPAAAHFGAHSTAQSLGNAHQGV